MRLEPIRFVAATVMAILLSGCSSLVEDQSTSTPSIASAAEIASVSNDPDPAEIEDLAEAIAICMADVVTMNGVIWLEVGVSEEQANRLGELLESSTMVVSYDYVDREETYANFLTWAADDPELLELLSADQLPTSFDVVLAREVETSALLAEVEEFDVVDDVDVAPDSSTCEAEGEAVSTACQALQTDIVVWLDLEVDDNVVEAISSALRESPSVSAVYYVGPDETYAEFESYFGDEPRILELAEPALLPTRFTVELHETVLAAPDLDLLTESLIAEWEIIQGVDEVLPEPGEAAFECADSIKQQGVGELPNGG